MRGAGRHIIRITTHASSSLPPRSIIICRRGYRFRIRLGLCGFSVRGRGTGRAAVGLFGKGVQTEQVAEIAPHREVGHLVEPVADAFPLGFLDLDFLLRPSDLVVEVLDQVVD
jgi:hypothetical protein